MRLTTFTDYSLRVLLFLAARPGQRATISEITRAFGVKENHLTKVVHHLGKVGLLNNVRGKGGGLNLAMPPEKIRIGEVVRQTEGVAHPAECFSLGDADNCCIAPICKLRGALNEAVQAFYLALDGYTLADIAENREELARILLVPRTQRQPEAA